MLSTVVTSYIALRRALGSAFTRSGAILDHFARFAVQRGDSYVRAGAFPFSRRQIRGLQQAWGRVGFGLAERLIGYVAWSVTSARPRRFS